MNNLAFVIHPVDPKTDVAPKFPLLGRVLPLPAIDSLSRAFPPLDISHISGCRSACSGKEFDFGFSAGSAYACMAETTILALEGGYESFTPGKDVKVEQVEKTTQLGTRHGFRLAGFRSFEQMVTEEPIDRTRSNTQRTRAGLVRS